MRAWVVLGASVMVAWAPRAWADVAPPAPEDLNCQRGTVATVPQVDPEARDERGRPLQAWPYCAVSTCASDADCDGGRVCSEDEIALCVQGPEGHRTARDRGCEPDGTCLNTESTCERSRRCVTGEGSGDGAGGEAPAESPGEAPASLEEPAEEERSSRTSAGVSGSCGCRTGGASAGGAAAALSFVALLFALRRRARAA